MTFYFYDLETSSGSPRTGRIMQFAGQRTDKDLKPVGDPDNVLVKLSDDVIPEPDAILIHGITPQKTLEEGLSEAQFTEFFESKIAKPGTIFIGYNNLRFDDEFMRRVLYRNFYDPYQWHWMNERSRWDLLDPIRMMRALRPEGLKWPMLDGKPSVKLELLAKENGLLHENAHDALSDVGALVGLARKFYTSQPNLFTYLLKMRDKKEVAKLVMSGETFVYTSGKYSSDFEKTTVGVVVAMHPKRDSAVVYDLRHDPTQWLEKAVSQLVEHWQVKYDEDKVPLPVKLMHFNRCPAVAPVSVLDKESIKRIKIDTEAVTKHHQILLDNPKFVQKIEQALDIIEDTRQTSFELETDVDNQIYDGFWSDADAVELARVRASEPEDLSKLLTEIKNKRIREMLPKYKARNFPKKLNAEEIESWENYKRKIFSEGGEKSLLAKFSTRMKDLEDLRRKDKNKDYLLGELQLYVESILPEF